VAIFLKKNIKLGNINISATNARTIAKEENRPNF